MKFYYKEEPGGCEPGQHRFRMYATTGTPENDTWIGDFWKTGDCACAPVVARICDSLNKMALQEKEEQFPEGEIFFPGLGTVRPCLDCGALIAGGATRCGRCAEDVRNLRAAKKAELVNLIESVLNKLAKATTTPWNNSKMLWNCDYDLVHQWVTWALSLAWEIKNDEIAAILSTVLATLNKSKDSEEKKFQLLLNNDFRFVRSLISTALRRSEDG